MKELKLMQTKAGKGFKAIIDNEWYYTSARELAGLGKGKVVHFRTIDKKIIPDELTSEQEDLVLSREDQIENDIKEAIEMGGVI